MGLLVSDDIGLIKTLNSDMSNEEIISNESGVGLAISRMCWLDSNFSRVAVSRTSGVIDIFELKEGEWSKIQSVDTDSVITSMSCFDSSLVVLSESSVLVLSSENYERISGDLLPDGPYTTSLALDKTKAIFSEGGLPPVIIDLNTRTILWKGKNAGDTPLGLTSKFTTESFVALSPTVFISGSAEGKLRFFDIDRQRKPIIELAVQEAYRLSGNYTGSTGQARPIRVLTIAEDRKTLFIGDTFGSVVGLNIEKLLDSSLKSEVKLGTRSHAEWARKILPLRFSVSGIMGSVRCIQVTLNSLFIATAGRHLYCYDLKTKRVSKQSFNQKLTYCLVSNDENHKRLRLS